ncbi:MAG: protein kinase [Candidatus Brocadiia bacterium]
MSADDQRTPAGTGGLTEGVELDGVELHQLLTADDFCSLWLTDPYEEGLPEACIRVIPAAHLQTPDAVERFEEELGFWEKLDSKYALHLYCRGEQDGYCFALMEYMPNGSVEEWAPDASAVNLPDLAMQMANGLCSLHAGPGPHGNLKPSNVFAVPSEGVRFSDFLLPLWLDELEAGSKRLEPRLLHRYLAPEQQINPRDYDQRSDIFSFAMILLRCLTGGTPPRGADGRDAEWPPALENVGPRCLEPDPGQRFADAQELYDALCEARGSTTHFVQILMDDDLEKEPPEVEPSQAPKGGALEEILAEAETCMESGRLEEAVDMLESISPDHPRVQELLDKIEERQETSERLAQEAVRLAGMGHPDAARDTVAQAAKLWKDSSTVAAVKRELDMTTGEKSDLDGSIPGPLVDALANERYAAARPLLEKLLREEPMTDEIREAVERFKRGRAKAAFLDNIHMARRTYLSGEHEEARRYWMEAARWLPRGPERETLRRIAAAAAKGSLVLAPEEVGTEGETPGENAESDLEFPSAPARPPGTWTGPIVIGVVALVAAILAVIAYLIFA